MSHLHFLYAACSLELWGYKRVEEIIWVKTNQLQRIIRTGRTGHWLNHSKEHCLVGIKGNPEVNRNIDTDVIVAEVRETSRKPDEVSTTMTLSFRVKLFLITYIMLVVVCLFPFWLIIICRNVFIDFAMVCTLIFDWQRSIHH